MKHLDLFHSFHGQGSLHDSPLYHFQNALSNKKLDITDIFFSNLAMFPLQQTHLYLVPQI